MRPAPYSPTVRDEITRLARRLGVTRLARELGVSRSAVGAMMAGTEQAGTRAIATPALARLRAELAPSARSPSDPPRAA